MNNFILAVVADGTAPVAAAAGAPAAPSAAVEYEAAWFWTLRRRRRPSISAGGARWTWHPCPDTRDTES